MLKLIKKLVVCVIVLGLQGGLGFAVSAAPINDAEPQTEPQSWSVQQDEISVLRQQEVARHEQAMLQRVNESIPDWQWRQWQEHEQHNRNMNQIQAYSLDLNPTPVNW